MASATGSLSGKFLSRSPGPFPRVPRVRSSLWPLRPGRETFVAGDLKKTIVLWTSEASSERIIQCDSRDAGLRA